MGLQISVDADLILFSLTIPNFSTSLVKAQINQSHLKASQYEIDGKKEPFYKFVYIQAVSPLAAPDSF